VSSRLHELACSQNTPRSIFLSKQHWALWPFYSRIVADASPKPAPFVWPPAAGGQAWKPLPPPPPRRRDKLLAKLAPYITAFERDWLGVLDGSWQRRAEEAGWQADALGDYCPVCGSSWGKVEGLCKRCDEQPVPWQRCVRLGNYEGVLRTAILSCKNPSGRALGEQVGKQLGDAVLAALERAQIPPQDAIVVPVPMSWLRWLSRGRDHTLALCRGMRARTGIEVLPLLKRAHRPMQTGTTLNVRRVNVRNSMRVKLGRVTELESRKPWPRVLILVDDVLTSGATMREAVRCLQAQGMFFSDQPQEKETQMQVWTAVAAVTTMPNDRGREGKGDGS
jgi:predicted amidophosphoribosyltransferase